MKEREAFPAAAPRISLVALDLDGTLLDSDKRLPPENALALERAAERGVWIVPTTGRLYRAMPRSILELPFLRYVISVNGAQVRDLATDTVLHRAEIPWERAVEVMRFLDGEDVIYDCYMDDDAWMSAALKERIDEFAPDEHFRRMLHELPKSVPELKAFLGEQRHDVQKVLLFVRDRKRHEELLREELPRRFPELLVTSSAVNNIELNAPGADKGTALLALADALGLSHEATMSFGDGLNDVSMLRAAGLGIAMANASDEVKAAADYVTASCDEHGVAAAMLRFSVC